MSSGPATVGCIGSPLTRNPQASLCCCCCCRAIPRPPRMRSKPAKQTVIFIDQSPSRESDRLYILYVSVLRISYKSILAKSHLTRPPGKLRWWRDGDDRTEKPLS